MHSDTMPRLRYMCCCHDSLGRGVCVEALKLGANRIVSARYMRIVIGICIDIDCCTVQNEVIPATAPGWLANTLTG